LDYEKIVKDRMEILMMLLELERKLDELEKKLNNSLII